MRKAPIAAAFLGILLFAAASIAGRTQKNDAPSDAVAFIQNLKQLCGQRFAGKAVFTPTPDDPMARAALVMHVASCQEKELRIPFHVGEDRTRTWILTLKNGGLQFKHDHRHDAKTPDEITNYGGMAAPGGSTWKQSFPADEFTAKLIPAAKTNVWTLELERENGALARFVYDLKRDGKQRFRAVFDLTKPLP